MVRDPEAAVACNLLLLEHTERVYPGLSYPLGVLSRETGELLTEVGVGKGMVEKLAVAQRHYDKAVACLSVCTGAEHPVVVGIERILSKLQVSVNRCAKPGCNKPRGKLCARCNLIGYCSRECQVGDWKKRHKHACAAPKKT